MKVKHQLIFFFFFSKIEISHIIPQGSVLFGIFLVRERMGFG